jgi:4,5-dihydroxyphthalate decarboxylase
VSTVPLSVAAWDYDRTRALIDGRVRVEGCDLTYLTLPPEECFLRAWSGAEFDVAELGFSSYLISLVNGNAPYVGIPVFLSRTFRHSGIYIRADRGIERPEDLRGKRVGVPIYEMAAAVWIRGLLNDEYGVAPADLQWVQGGLESPGRKVLFDLHLPTGFPLEPAPPGKALSAMLAAGELDAIVTARAPSCFDAGDPNVRRLFTDYRSAELAYYERTHIFPIMHVVGVRRSLTEAHPWLAASLLKGFTAAKAIADSDLRESVAPKTGLPWIVAEYDATVRSMGRDFWPYGVERNRPTLEAMAAYVHSQGLIARPIGVAEMFAGTTYHEIRI